MKSCVKWLVFLLVLSLHTVSAHASAQQDSIYLYSSPLTGPLLQFSIQAPGNFKGLTFFVVHPSISKSLISVMLENSNFPKPVIQKIDPYRSAIVFDQNLLAGTYSYKIDF